MPINKLKEVIEWVSVNILGSAYLVKDWVFLNVGAGVSSVVSTEGNLADIILKYAIGLSILTFNIVRIIKYVKDSKIDKK